MAELEREVSELYGAYVAELGAAFDQIAPWWARLRASHGRRALKLRWPAGVASHPRILAIYRDYHHRLSALRAAPPRGPAPRFDDDEAWGSEVEPEPETLIPPAPERLLIDRLQVEAKALYAKMIYLLMSPVGVAPDPRPTMRSLEVVERDPRRAHAFGFEGRHGVQRGVDRLLGAGFDLRPSAYTNLSLDDASEVHRLAHDSYKRELEEALHEAERWWANERSEREVRGMSAEQARDDAYASHAVGPAGHPAVIGVIQAYWALCHEINGALIDAAQHVAPEQLLLGWLQDGRHGSWVAALTAMPYWPVGLDRAGRWV
ncbi:hypothetical protein ENSA5_13990 [Enhygromyxa salina]|uniref:Uncharacterized protein n=1 Tax=Enhygromyxa salina TaxID=215803 RepID=A0A2S9YEU2_9BACT|nr:hypothetical protein [Enhygromyxa salina]PRQ03644.1 hypothetical protein ENSA5_13990 [Enhygromyxa salina]